MKFTSYFCVFTILAMGGRSPAQDPSREPTSEEIAQYLAIMKSRVCIKSFPWPWADLYGKKEFPEEAFGKHLGELDAKEMGEIRTHIANFVAKYAEDPSAVKARRPQLSAADRSLLDHLEIGLERSQVQLYADVVYLAKLGGEQDYPAVLRTIADIRRKHPIPVKGDHRTPIEKECEGNTYLGTTTLGNMIATMEFQAKVQVADNPQDLVTAVTQFLDNRRTLLPFFELGLVKDPTDAILARLGNQSTSKLKGLRGIQVTENDKGATLRLQGQNTHTLLVNDDGEVTLRDR
jgi:hypothetical protein